VSGAAALVLTVGTRRGLFRLVSDPERSSWELEGPFLVGFEVYHALLDPRDPRRGWAALRHPVWGAHVHVTRDGGRSWEPLPGRPAFPEDTGRTVEALWHVAPGGPERPERLWAGSEPAALFTSEDGGATWSWVRSLDEHPTRGRWQAAKGGMALHSIQVDPSDPDRVYVAVSAGGCYRTEDAGESWTPINAGVRADFLPGPPPEAGQCVHALRLHPALPSRLYQQNHCGTYRSDDRGSSWVEITGELPSDFGYVIGLDPRHPDHAWVIPEESSHMRSVCDARLRVFETSDAGARWTAREEGLPQRHAYASVLREAMCTDGRDPCGVHFGTSTGQLFTSPDGRRWTEAARYLPKILSVTASPAP
jgi:hypothetical protein